MLPTVVSAPHIRDFAQLLGCLVFDAFCAFANRYNLYTPKRILRKIRQKRRSSQGCAFRGLNDDT